MSPAASRLSQSQHTLTDGVSVERLPIGNVTESGDAVVMFVFSPASGKTFRFPEEGTSPWRSVGITPRSGRADFIEAGGGGSDHRAMWITRLRLPTPCELEFVYRGEDDTLVREAVFVDPTVADGQHRVELPDGSVIERLPIGIAAGACWLRFVRTGIPDTEVERWEAYDDVVEAALEAGDDHPDIDDPWPEPMERFLQLRSGGRLLPCHEGGYTEGGPDQRFEVAVPADQIDSELEIGYLFDGGVVVSTERVILT